jgi:hypothetical protein
MLPARSRLPGTLGGCNQVLYALKKNKRHALQVDRNARPIVRINLEMLLIETHPKPRRAQMLGNFMGMPSQGMPIIVFTEAVSYGSAVIHLTSQPSYPPLAVHGMPALHRRHHH